MQPTHIVAETYENGPQMYYRGLTVCSEKEAHGG